MTQTHTQCPQVEPEQFPRRTLRWLIVLFILALVGSVLLGLAYHSHAHFAYDGEWWFYWAYGFVASVAMVIVSKFLGFFLKRRENYWEGKS